jgi:hypothetical protein
MADDNSVEIRFSASTEDALAAIADIRDGLTGLTAPVSGLGSNLDRLGETFNSALPLDLLAQAKSGFGETGNAAANTAVQVKAISDSMKALQQDAAAQKTLLDAEVSQFQITQNQKYALLEEEMNKEYLAQVDLLLKKANLEAGSVKGTQDVLDRIALLSQKHDTDMRRLNDQSIAAQQAQWEKYLSTVTGAFNSQLRGLLEGTTNWHKATIKMLEDLTIKFIELAEQMVVKWVSAELAKTTATTTGAAVRATAEQGASDAGLLANAAAAMKSIATDAAQTFGGVFAFLSPTMGPAAAGPAAAAEASVSAAAIFDVGTDYVVRGGLALIHPGETIIPAARGSGPYGGAGAGPQVHAPVSINVSALDSQSVSRFINDNSRHMLRAINDAVKRGAHIGLRR